jgi:hypothetical protein
MVTELTSHGLATAWLSEACAPWSCRIFLRVRVGETELSMPVDRAWPALDAVSTLLASAVEGVTR